MDEKEAFGRGVVAGLALAHNTLTKAVARGSIDDSSDLLLLAQTIKDGGTQEFIDSAYEFIAEFEPS